MDVSDQKADKGILIKNNVKTHNTRAGGCRFEGSLEVRKVAGEITFLHEGNPNPFNIIEFLTLNTSHAIDHLRFGPEVPGMTTPLVGVKKSVQHAGIVDRSFEY